MQEKKGLYERAKYERGIASFLRDLMVRSEGRELTEGQLVYTVGALGDLSWQDKVWLAVNCSIVTEIHRVCFAIACAA